MLDWAFLPNPKSPMPDACLPQRFMVPMHAQSRKRGHRPSPAKPAEPGKAGWFPPWRACHLCVTPGDTIPQSPSRGPHHSFGDVDNQGGRVSYSFDGRNATRAKSLFGIEGIETTWNNETRWFCEADRASRAMLCQSRGMPIVGDSGFCAMRGRRGVVLEQGAKRSANKRRSCPVILAGIGETTWMRCSPENETRDRVAQPG